MSPVVTCITDTVTKLAFYAVIAYLIHAMKIVIITFINRRAELMDLFVPRTPVEVGVDQARRHGVFDFETDGDEVH